MEYVKRGFMVNYDVTELGLIKPFNDGYQQCFDTVWRLRKAKR